MSTILTYLLFVPLAFFGLADLLVYICGKETFSRLIIKRSKASKRFAILTLLIIFLFSMWLTWHFELPNIIWGEV